MQIQNPDATQVIRDQAKITLAEGFPQNLLPNVQPVMDMTPRFHRETSWVKSASRTTTGSGTIVTVETTKDTYVTGIYASLVKDATADTAISDPFVVTFVIGGVTTNILRMSVNTLTAQEKDIFISFDRPVKIDRGSAILISGAAFTVGTQARSATVYGYQTQ